MFDHIETLFLTVLNYAIIIVEILGAMIILYFTFLALVSLLRRQHDKCKDLLTEGISTGLNFLLASEVLKTIIAPDWNDIGMTCAILLMRVAMSVLVHWENKIEHQMQAEIHK